MNIPPIRVAVLIAHPENRSKILCARELNEILSVEVQGGESWTMAVGRALMRAGVTEGAFVLRGLSHDANCAWVVFEQQVSSPVVNERDYRWVERSELSNSWGHVLNAGY